MDDEELGAQLRELRKRRGLTQEGLAEAAGLSAQCIKKIERGGSARIETYRKIAEALGATTVWFTTPRPPKPVAESEDLALLADMRAAIIPPVGMDGSQLYGTADQDDVSLTRLRDATQAVAMAYHNDHYDHVAQVLPALIRSARYHVSWFSDGEEHREAIRLRGNLLGLAGRYLVQLREHDLALIAVQQSMRDASAIGDMPLAASGMCAQAWAMLRQGRFTEVERLCVQAADRIEPRMSQATPSQLTAWGKLLMRAAASAVRNNRTAEARELLTLANAAGARMDREQQQQISAGQTSFGPITVALLKAETEMIAGEPARALQIMDNLPRGAGRPSDSTWNRGQIEKARALVEVGNIDRATEVLTSLKAKAPQWLRYQERARDATQAILKARTRMPNAQQRELADFLGVRE